MNDQNAANESETYSQYEQRAAARRQAIRDAAASKYWAHKARMAARR